MRDPEIIVSIDVRADGPVPGLHSMRALGAAAYDDQENALGTWYGRIRPLPEAGQRPGAMTRRDGQPAARAGAAADQLPASDMIPDFGYWLESFRWRPVAVAWPAASAFAFASYYLWRFFGRNPFRPGAIDIRSYASGLAGCVSCYGLPEREIWQMAGEAGRAGLRPQHALDGAVELGRLFLALRRRAWTCAPAARREHHPA